LERFREWFETLRYENPARLWTLIATCTAVCTLAVLAMAPSTAFVRAVGIPEWQTRGGALLRAAYWAGRAALNAASDERPTRRYGSMEGVDDAGNLIASLPDGTRWVTARYRFADLTIMDAMGVARHVALRRGEDARFEIYRGDQVVVWIGGGPFNIALIDAGFAEPDPHPPTNIVDIAFATYYWNVARGARGNSKEGGGSP